ncbi:MAG: signal peptidase II [Candidatus Cyclobacteriaceae bacterium M3_2C_046]
MKFFRNAVIFAGAWIIAMLIYTLIYQVEQTSYILSYTIIPALFLGVVALFSTAAAKHTSTSARVNLWALWILLSFDQAIKIYLFQTDWQTIQIPLIEPVFYFSPSHNQAGSYFFHLLSFKKDIIWLNILLVSSILLLVISYWHFYREKRPVNFWSSGAIHLILTGIIANLTDSIFHGGSLDFITINPFYVFDLKDTYLTIAMLFIITEAVEQKGRAYGPMKGLGFKYIAHDIKNWLKWNKGG